MNRAVLFSLVLFGALQISVAQQTEKFASHVLSFIPNKGQIVTDRNEPATTVHFKADVRGLEFYVTDNGVSYVFVKHNRDEYDPALGGQPNPDFKPTTDFGRVDMNLIGATINRNNVITEFPTESRFNFYYAHCPDGIIGVQGYRRLTYKNIYPLIDWVISCNEKNEMKYEFIVHPGGNAADIKMEYKWADIDVSDKNIILSTPMGKISEQDLYCYSLQSNQQVNSFYEYDGKYVTVNASVPTGETLVIDPPLVWSTYWGGAGAEQPQALVCSGTGEYVFVAGYTGSAAYPTLNPGGGAYYQGTIGGSTDAFVVKFDTSGIVYWSTYYGGTGAEGSTSYTGVSIACGAGNSLWMVGTTTSVNLPLQNPGGGAYYQSASAGSDDFFIAKFDLAGVRSYCTYFGGSLSDGGSSHGCGADCDANGNFYFSGRTTSTNFPMLNPGGGAYFDNSQNGSDDLAIVKLSAAGVLLWSTYLGGTGDDMNYSMDLHVDKVNSQLYVASCAGSTNLPTMTPGPLFYYDATQNGLTDMYFARFSLTGVMNWATYIGGSGDEWLAMSVNTAPDGDVALITLTGSTNMPMVTPGGSAFFDNTHNGGSYDIYLCRLESTGQMSWSTYYGSPNNEHCQHNLTIDANGNIIMCGVSDGTSAPPTFNPGAPHFYDGTKDAQGTYCLVQFSPAGVMLWGTYWGGSGHDHLFGTVGKCIGVSNHSDIFVCGETSSTDLPMLNPGGGAYYNTTPGQGFVAKFNNDIVPIILPIELMYWHCESNADAIVLKWATASENNCDHFTIERSSDDGNWEAIGTFSGHGTTYSLNEYIFTDKYPLAGNNYYRLSQTDYNGNTKYYSIVGCDHVGKNVLMQVYNVSGQLLFSENTSDYRSSLHRAAMSPGVYIVDLHHANDKISVKYLKLDNQ